MLGEQGLTAVGVAQDGGAHAVAVAGRALTHRAVSLPVDHSFDLYLLFGGAGLRLHL